MIKATGIEKSYNNEKVLKGVSLTVTDGEFVSVMGESGSGKSTLISILGGFLTPDIGSVEWDGVDIFSLTEDQTAKLRHTSTGFVFQSFKLVGTLTSLDNILLPLTLGKTLDNKRREYVNSLVSELGLEHVISKYPDQLSGGQRQRVAIARALSYKPKTVILDEPTGALDSVMEEKVMRLLQRINKEQGVTIIQVTHSQKVAGYGSRIIYVKDGQIQG